ncbi:hypothetical protein M413DRAFT_27905 [Hebeloma cylindrosporum]|uniref:PPM-type phosphatase domain-containing protein n=1 Tax=Hebeloma cylindrosporum TaxID=76867 RepID=A0A0C3CDD9_HEBCY|nr:hypothetical protein M413DRAFT_27905 [Hebeloma cylindrosporum h7]
MQAKGPQNAAPVSDSPAESSCLTSNEDVVGRIVSPTLTCAIPPEYGVCIHAAQYQPTEPPIEDRFSLDFDPIQNRLIIGVYDGHGGPDTSEYVSKSLPLRLLQHPPSKHSEQFKDLDDSILHAFKRDHSFFRPRSANWIHNAQLIKSGSTALVLDIDLKTLSGAYANAGDCRLVLCHGGVAVLETKDLNSKTPSEQERLVREHPKEDQLLVGNRLFGRLMSTRGFGDGYYKLPTGFLGMEHRRYIDTLSAIEKPGKIPMNDQYAPLFFAYKTPPYVTPTPQTGEHQLEKGDIIIMATDGLWDLISTKEASEIVLQGAAETHNDLARYLLERVKALKSPGDDVTILVIQV